MATCTHSSVLSPSFLCHPYIPLLIFHLLDRAEEGQLGPIGTRHVNIVSVPRPKVLYRHRYYSIYDIGTQLLSACAEG